MPINTGSFPKSLWPGVNAWYGKAYNEHTTEYTDLFAKNTSRRAYEEDVGSTGLALASVKAEGQPITYDEERQGFLTRYTHVNYGSGFIITEEAMDDDLYDVVGERKSKSLAFSMRQTKEIVGANVYNNGFSASFTGGDGVAMLNGSHPNVSGGTWSNILATASDLSEAALEQACIDIQLLENDRGLKIAISPVSLHVHPNDVFEADRILNTPLRVGTANNDINALKAMGKFAGGANVNHYFTDTDAWFIRTNCPDSLKYFERKGDAFAQDNDFDTSNAKFKATGRYSFGWTDPRGIFGSPGV